MDLQKVGIVKTHGSVEYFVEMLKRQHLYLRQPGYGTSYITGKYLMEDAMMAFALKKEKMGVPFKLHEFFDTLNSIGNIPMSLAKRELVLAD